MLRFAVDVECNHEITFTHNFHWKILSRKRFLLCGPLAGAGRLRWCDRRFNFAITTVK
jgi:hypothetical protein